MTLPGYVFALIILLGSLVLLAAVAYLVLCIRRRRQSSVLQREVP
ncbi:hypothetical protein [Pseudarthrobacter sp. 1C304]